MKMNQSGKISTIILVAIVVLLVSFTAIAFFFFLKESEMRKAAEEKLTQAKTAEAKLQIELEEKKKQIVVLEQKTQESDEKINDLFEELELQTGVKDQMKSENDSLREALKKESADKETLHQTLVATQEKLSSLEGQLQTTESTRTQLEAKIKEIEQGEKETDVQLEKIVVTPGEIPEGKIVSINHENNFIVVNLGQEHGIKQDLVLSIYRKNKYLGDVKVARIQEGMAVADFIAPFTSKQVKKDDRVMVKK